MKVTVCDVCKHEGKLKESKWKVGFKGDDKVDLCDEHKNSPPKDRTAFIKWRYQLHGINLSDEDAKKLAANH